VGLLDHLEAILQQMDLRYQQRFDAQTKAVDSALVATERRFEGVNEFRKTLADQARDLMPRLEAEQRMGQLADEIAALRGTSRAGASALLGWIVGAIGLVTGVIAIVSTFAAR